MAKNSTVTFTEERLQRLMISYVIYGSSGVITIVINFLFIASIYKHELLRARKEYIVLSALILMDLLYGYAYTTAGIGRTYYILSGTANRLVSRMGCVAKTWNWVFFPLIGTYGATPLMVSVDRLLSMSVPLRYLQWSRSYALKLIAVFYAPYVPVVFYAGYEAQKDDRVYLSQLCHGRMLFSSSLHKLLSILQAAMAMASVIAYVAVVIMYRLRTKRAMKTMSNSTQRKRLESQRHLMVTVGLSCLATMCLWVSPAVLLNFTKIDSMLHPLITCCVALHHMVNALLFFWRHKTIRKAIYCLLTNQKLTESMIDALSKHQSNTRSFNVRVHPTNGK